MKSKKELREAIIWRKSVYDNHFKCQKCGCKLADENGNPTDNVSVNAEGLDVDNRLFCYQCFKKGEGNVVATMKIIPADGDEVSLMGNWVDRADHYEKAFDEADRTLERLKEIEKTLKKKLSEIAELESKVTVLENRCKNKDAEIKKYSKKLQDLTKENDELRHRIEELIERNTFNKGAEE